MTNENQKRQKEEESKQKRLLKESRQKAKEAEKENKIRQKAKENAKRLAEKNSTDLPPATASEKAPDNERAADVKPAGDEISDTRPSESSDEEQKKKPVHKNYHVSLRDDGKWQVKFAKGEKALKLFDTQAEAITFAKEKAKNQDGNITIHKTDGKIRKQNYSKRD